MTRKDYQLIADALKHANGCGNSPNHKRAIDDAVFMVSKALASDNPAFNREMFLKACGI